MTSYKLSAELPFTFPNPFTDSVEFETTYIEIEITYGYLSSTNDYVVEHVSVLREGDVGLTSEQLTELAEEYLASEEGHLKARELAANGYNEVGYEDYPDPPFDEDKDRE